ncbi:DegT/DnrJ/EryC1/StrS family aminotransferase [Candidatus Peregrinibacteria bacterium]|nr:DegT/DnrJ/EryC1/StrS family aminotransferase [Candidatus Peregrinibacteria bacterium]
MKIPQVLPFINESEVREITRVVRSTFITQGKATRSFEEKFQKLTKTKFAIAVFNATVGLYSALKALDIGPGDEIIVPDLTFIATANAVIMAGARPIFCDIDRKTFNLHPGFIEKFINKNTKAIMPVHLYGQPADMDEIMKIAKKHKLFVIEDAAESVGARFRGKYVGTFGDIGVFSFYANKIMTTAEGGLILTNNPLLAKKCLALRNHGRIATGTFIHPYIGFNFKFTDLQAAIGLAQFKKLPKMNAKKQKILDWYRYFLKDVKDISFPYVDPRCSCVIWLIFFPSSSCTTML